MQKKERDKQEIIYTGTIPLAQEVDAEQDNPFANLSDSKKKQVLTAVWVATAIAVACVLILVLVMWFMANFAGPQETDSQMQNAAAYLYIDKFTQRVI